jgi:hypothetical protein
MREFVSWMVAGAVALVCSLLVSAVILGLLFVTTAGCAADVATEYTPPSDGGTKSPVPPPCDIESLLDVCVEAHVL